MFQLLLMIILTLRKHLLQCIKITNSRYLFVSTDGTEDVKIIKSFFWEENGVKFGNFTCNASSYFPEVRYIWSVPCQSESLINGASVCRTAFEDRRSEVTCIAVYSSGGFTVEGLLNYLLNE